MSVTSIPVEDFQVKNHDRVLKNENRKNMIGDGESLLLSTKAEKFSWETRENLCIM